MSGSITPVSVFLTRLHRMWFRRVLTLTLSNALGRSGHTGQLRLLLAVAMVLSAAVTSASAVASPLQVAATGVFSPDEEQWIREHSVVEVGVYAGDHMPVEGW